MATTSRSARFTKIHKVLKKHYKPVTPHPDRPVLEHLIFACCLEDAGYDKAEEALASVLEAFFDWNEVRVSSVRELAEVMAMARLPDPPAAATRLKKVLQHVFEDSYTFDLESLRKKNLGPAEEDLRKINGVTRFAVSYVIQSALGGHSIPIDAGVGRVLEVLDLASEQDIEEGSVPGLERAIAKNKGIEFGSLLHQLGAEMTDDPFAEKLHKILLEIDPDCKERLPRRPPRKKRPQKAQKAAAKRAGDAKSTEKSTMKPTEGATKKVAVKAAGRSAKKADKQAVKKTAKTASRKKTPAAKKSGDVQRKPAATARPEKAKAPGKGTAAAKKKKPVSRQGAGKSSAKKKPAGKLSKRKPR